MSKFERQGAILRLVRERQLATQAELADALRQEGIDAVQATLSRDITQLGLVKVRANGRRLVYALPGAGDLDRLNELAGALRRWALTIVASGNVVVVGTPTGCASALAQAVDDARLPDVIGTVAGDNTILVVAREGVPGEEVAQSLRHHLEGAIPKR
jgi:transcriptional regulator of arginine metabolism